MNNRSLPGISPTQIRAGNGLIRGADTEYLPQSPGDLIQDIELNLKLLEGQYLTQDDILRLKNIRFDIGVIERESGQT